MGACVRQRARERVWALLGMRRAECGTALRRDTCAEAAQRRLCGCFVVLPSLRDRLDLAPETLRPFAAGVHALDLGGVGRTWQRQSAGLHPRERPAWKMWHALGCPVGRMGVKTVLLAACGGSRGCAALLDAPPGAPVG